MVNKIALSLLILLLGACASQEKLKVVQFLNVDSYFYGASVDLDTSSFRIAHRNNCTLYEVRSIKGNIITEVVGDSIVNTMYPSKEYITRYFVVKNGAKTGLKYDSLVTDLPRKFRLDSLLEMLTIDERNMTGFEMDLGKPVNVRNEGANDVVLIEQYFAKTGPSTIDSVYRFYDKRLKDIDFSFSRKLDSLKKSKLYKTSLIFLPSKDKNGNLSDRRKTDIEIKKVMLKGEDKDKLMAVFNRFKNDSNK